MNNTKTGRNKYSSNRELSFYGNASVLASGSAIASLISLAAEPVVSRLFPPEVFGIVYAFYSLVSIIGLVMCFRYEQAIVLPDNRSDAAGLIKLSVILLFAWMVVICLFLWTTEMVEWLGWESIRPVVWLLPLLTGLSGLWYILTAWFIRNKKFFHISISSVLVQIPQVFLIIIGGYLGLNTAIHFIDYRIAGILAPPLFLLVFFIIQDKWMFKTKHRIRDLAELAKRYRKFPLYEFWAITMSVIAFNGPVLLFPVLFDAFAAGHFSKAVYVLYVIPIMIGNSFSQVLYQQMAEIRNRGDSTEPIVRKTLKSVILIGTVPLILVGIAGPQIFAVVLGLQWAEAGLYSQYLTLWLFFLLLSTSVQSVYLVFEKQEIALLFNFLAAAVRLGILIVCAGLVRQHSITILLTVLIFSLVSGLLNAAKIMYVGHLIKLRFLSLIGEVKPYLLLMILMAVLYILLIKLFTLSSMMVFLSGAVLGAAYYAILLGTQPAIKRLILSFIQGNKGGK